MVSLGSLGYSFSQSVNILDVSDSDLEGFKSEWSNPNSEVAKCYLKGIDQRDYAIDLKLYQKAVGGDLKALEAFERRTHQRKSRS